METSLEKRRRQVQGHELDIQIDELASRLRKFENVSAIDHLKRQWRAELFRARRLKIDLLGGQTLSDDSIRPRARREIAAFKYGHAR